MVKKNGSEANEKDIVCMQEDTNVEIAKLLEDLSVAVIVVVRDDGIIRYANKRVYKDLDKTNEGMIGRHYKEVFLPEFIPFYNRLQNKCDNENDNIDIYYWAKEAICEQISAHSIVWQSEPAICLTITNISDAVRENYLEVNKSYFDNLLGLPNGVMLEEDINELVNVDTVALIYFEIERFKDINKLYGWENGDRLLKLIRDWMLESEHQGGALYRLSDGFASLGHSATLPNAKKRARGILNRFKKAWIISNDGDDISIICTVKLGIVFGKYIRNEMRSLLLRTIQAVTDHNSFVVYDDTFDKAIKRELRLRDELVHCIHNGMRGFEVYYQPIVETKTKRWTGVEALCRWTAPGGEWVPPDEFIHIAEHLGLIGQLDSWVRKTALKQCTSLGLNKKDFVLDLNFSPTQSVTDAFVDDLAQTLKETGFPPEKVNIEITESKKMIFNEESLRGLERLRKKGIKLSLDDFGTGYSTFENLFRMRANSLKTEKIMLDGIEGDDYRKYILHMLVDLAERLKMKLVAEGVESESQHNLLEEYRVGNAQGYLFSKPLSFEQLKEKIDKFS